MRRKLMALLLCFVMVLPLFLTGCGEKDTGDDLNEESSARAAVTLNMWIMTEKPVSAETEKMIEDAFSELTKSKYTTKVDLVFVTEDEYYEALDAKFASVEEARANEGFVPSVETEEVEETAAATEVNELGQRLLKYPDMREDQLDIIFLSGKSNLKKYSSENKLSQIDTILESSSKILYDYISPVLMNNIRLTKNETYAVPVNHPIGQYTYLLINKALAEKYYIDIEGNAIRNIYDSACQKLIEDIGKNEKDIAPVLSYVDPVNLHYLLDLTEAELADPTLNQIIYKIGDDMALVFGDEKNMDAVLTDDGVLMVPVTFEADAMNAELDWDGESRVIPVTKGANEIIFTVDSATAKVNGQTVTFAAPVAEDNGTVFVPFGVIAEAVGATVENDGTTITVTRRLPGAYSLLATYVGTTYTYSGQRLDDETKSCFYQTKFTEHMKLMQKCKDNGWFAEDPENTDTFGVAIMTGDYTLRDQYADEYEVKVLTYPEATESEVYSAMFAVSSYTANLTRAMEIITFINTNEAAKNLLQYGIEGVHYEFDDDGKLVYLNDDYRMNNLYTGNMFLAYPDPTQPDDIWENAKKMNRDAKLSVFFGLSDSWNKDVSLKQLAQIRDLSDEYMDRIAACKDLAELTALIDAVKSEVQRNEIFRAAMSSDADSNSPMAVFKRWGNDHWPAPSEEV